MGDLKDGDKVFDEKGQVCTVTKAHEVLLNRDCYRVEFSDGSFIIADGEHLWETESAYARSRQSRERLGLHKRNPLLSDSVRSHLLEMAANSAPSDVITMTEIEELTGLTHSSSILIEAAKRVGPAGSIVPVRTFSYTGGAHTRLRELPVWPTRPILEAVLASGRVREQAATNRVSAAIESAKEDSVLTMPDIARLLGRPTRNAGLRVLLKSLGVESRLEKVAFTAQVATATIERTFAAVTTYPKASILTHIAEHCANLRGDQRHLWIEPAVAVRTTNEIRETLRFGDARQSANHAIRVAGPLELPEADLPVQPYTLGAWLGDGDSRRAYLTGIDHEVAQFISEEGYATSEISVGNGVVHPDYRRWKIADIQSILKQLGLIQSTVEEASRKRIPEIYLRSSIAQRRALLAGLLDTDGTVSLAGSIQFDNTNEVLANQVRELALSLGYRATIVSKTARLNGVDHGLVYRVSWTTQEPVFRLSRKLLAQAERTKNFNVEKNNRRYITDVVKVDSVPVRCITVDSESHLYLAGEAMIPTHNTQQVAYILAGQMRHRDMGVIIVDPQGQWAAEEGMAFSLQGFASEMGRDVRVRRISEHLRLGKDAALFMNLLGKTRFLPEITKMSPETQELVLDEMQKIVRDIDAWEDANSQTLMHDVMTTLVDPNAKYISRIYADESRQDRLRDAISDILDSPKRFAEVLRLFSPIHNLFQAVNPLGGTRHSLWAEITAVFDRPAGTAAPLLILDMSSKAAPGMNDEAAMAAADAYEVLENDAVKAAVLRNLFATLKRASEDQFRNGRNLNTLVALDEAWRYAPNPQGIEESEIVLLSKELAGYARDTRKFGIGWLYISQSTRSVNLNIWDQMSVRIFGYGLSGMDLDKMGEIVDDRSSLRLYRGFANPRSTGRYPFLLTGPVSPLSANATPIVLNVYTDFQDFRDDNIAWIKAIRDQLGQPLASGAPATPKGSAAKPLPRIDRKAAANPVKAIIETNTAVKDNLASSGVADAAGFADPLGNLDDDQPLPF
jgi:hypothetical protein